MIRLNNEILWFFMLVVNFSLIIFAYKKFGKIGLYIWIPVSTIIANIQVVLLVDLFGFGTTLGNILYAGGFLVTDILAENYGRKHAQKAVYIGFFSLIALTAIMQIAVSFTPTNVEEAIILFDGVKRMFDFMPRIAIASLVAYLVSQSHDIWAYEFWKKKYTAPKYIWIRNNASTMVSQIIDNAIFTMIAFYGVYPKEVLIEIFLTTYLMKFLVAVCDTPFVYMAHYLKKKNMIEEID
ncbi:queuosine precursor transporter [Fusobacterium sp. DD29]|uniref:queuosine precursor transporter n=1 Tax=unclassified Fusobacterium TaxID=2648384 RepID=UPI001B8CED2D|nr:MULTISPECIES: queuosine precursor transporter [unclassified Fusobacterium]MBR8700372.1 queuosine precursor transporter [Fusobacterium sp. DD45]MBR8710065.1 queuosine precursor transporter [Fusobacterium sp. DD28]MBR8748365.1 queuosine precursor transporter [Fusobacterium sp. DD29]MBR8750643.1 queuosine precursor transporter [Fusobacterium sp. DD26]MBR8760661.1 queuosine precursor transporter [Fusobacterium sp. DD25]